MAKKKKKSAQPDSNGEASTAATNGSASTPKQPAGEPSTSALIICRNKHWRYISSFHGPWLQLPPEVLESLAHSNYLSPRPRPIDPAVFYDLVKIRKHVEEATNLAVRATSGLTSGALSSSSLHGNGLLGPAAALGMGFGGGGGKLSRERKHRMRELATSKLSAAYHLDEIAASVATMQSASTLEDVAQLVLQRNPSDVDAKYVHFFHEKIPSRMMAQCTPLDTLNDIVAERPTDGSALRTRALTRIFKADYANCAKDLTDALATARCLTAQHRNADDQLVLAKTHQEQSARDWRTEVKIADDDQPSSLEAQLLFHRAGVYLTIACGHVHAALDGLKEQEDAKAARDARLAAGEEPAPETAEEAAGRLFRAESRKQVRQNAKRALRDYTAFLSHFDYTPGVSAEAADEFLRRFSNAPSQTNGSHGSRGSHGNYDTKLDRLLEESSAPPASPVSEALTPYRKPPAADRSWPKLPPPPVFAVSQLFDAVPPAALPPYPPAPQTPPSPIPSNESLTYHPLLPDALHSLLLVHALLQTPPKELLRHAHNAARLARLLDGYPIFLAARSPARSDWVEVLRRGGNWVGLLRSWESLCRSSPPPGQSVEASGQGQVARAGARNAGGAGSGETKEQRRERQKHEAILEALADERVVDEESFQRAVRAREKRFRDDEKAEAAMEASAASSPTSASAGSNGTENAPTPPKRWAQEEDAREYPISTERAEAISRWVRDAPALTSQNNTGTKKKRRKGTAKKPGLSKASSTGLAGSVASLNVDEEVE
ncbi:hypothetical protein BU25DRAFT_469682 [Macroventuria anomochaeta]|uniref:Uncharacterized protein n=1 Tax=Macroventuria anomochaeta TaxID=301207 RepID=A0ACB6S1G0_9PLEO|nr:uncharacterized protein BU25DRAFT_469682 [Macroventuria anomochaeta]KAF2627233.1 hypothetical protein BU25DRAFT_469682 [Macroventuria anomochaeta]